MMVINDELQPVPTSITEKVQFRVYKDTGESGHIVDRGDSSSRQPVYELVMRRRDLLAGRHGGLHSVTPDETEYQLTSIPMGVSREAHLRGVVVLSTCVRCHSSNGIFSVNTYGHSINGQPLTADSVNSNPQLRPATSIGYQGNATADWKTRQLDWGLLRGLLEADVPTRSHH